MGMDIRHLFPESELQVMERLNFLNRLCHRKFAPNTAELLSTREQHCGFFQPATTTHSLLCLVRLPRILAVPALV